MLDSRGRKRMRPHRLKLSRCTMKYAEKYGVLLNTSFTDTPVS